jgi:replicative DNA helicase
VQAAAGINRLSRETEEVLPLLLHSLCLSGSAAAGEGCVARAAEDLGRARPARVPPHNLEAEESVLGSMMLSGEAIAGVVDIVKEEDYYRPVHQRIHRAILAVYARGEPVDAITTVEELKRKQMLDEVGGPLYVYNLVQQVPTPASAPYYARIVADHAMLRRLIEAASKIMATAYAVPEDPRKAADQAEGLVYAVSRQRDQDEVISVRELVDESMSALEHIQQRDSQFAGVPTGFRDLDELLSGLQKGNLIVIAARPGVGKSSFVTNVARNVAMDGHPVAMFSLEMSRFEIGMRLLCGEAGVPWDKVRGGHMGPDDWTRIVAAAERLHEIPLYIVDSGNVTIVDIRAKARRLRARREGLGCVIVDYMQLMSGHARTESRQQEIAEISRSLKLLAKELEIPVIAVSQLNRDPERRQDKRPQLSDLRESGAIEQDSDIVMFIHREDSEDLSVKGKADVIVAKHRNGPTAVVPLTFLPHLTQFRNFARVG